MIEFIVFLSILCNSGDALGTSALRKHSMKIDWCSLNELLHTSCVIVVDAGLNLCFSLGRVANIKLNRAWGNPCML